MKRVLLKPQRNVPNTVLAYEDEEDGVSKSKLYVPSAYCNWEIEGCTISYNHDGDCTAITWTGDGWTIFTCFDG